MQGREGFVPKIYITSYMLMMVLQYMNLINSNLFVLLGGDVSEHRK